ncbi:hypothetical protein IEO21_04249 [Rhodonia placenta]|uniref:Dihydroorotate dehydrogenase (quinone), mitochondrial n=1 Tax=Rhodonia placenta TaxID=104341 RepID=A0A8H7U3F2_9APHY|nr:hypothetical protein IEO21_04249 [Postia placenta]
MLRLKPRLPRLQPPHRHASTSSVTPSARSPPSSLRTGLYASALLLSTGVFAAYYFDSRAALHRYVVTPVLRHTLDPETAHRLAVRVLASGWAPRDTRPDDEVLRTELWGEELANPVGLAAGFDKHGEAVDGLFDLGFGWVEIGSITPKPQPGNPRPRMFHLASDDAVINRYGFPSDGHTLVLARLRARISPFIQPDAASHASLRPGALLAVNLGKNKTSPADSAADFVAGVHAFAPYADVLVVNVSSPNTPGLRSLQGREQLQTLLDSVTRARDEVVASASASGEPVRRPRLLLKIAPDLEEAEVADIAAVVRNSAVDGVIVSNTTVRRPDSLIDPNKAEAGGLSGAPLKPYALATLRALRRALPARVPVVGCGGIASGADALEFARAGAAAVQVYTSFGYDGPGAVRRIKDELAAALRREGTTWDAVVREAVERLSLPEGEAGVEGEGKEGKGTIRQLTEEAEELMRLVDGLAAQASGVSI